MKTISQLKTMALGQLKSNWYMAIIAALILSALKLLAIGSIGRFFNFYIIVWMAIMGPLWFGFVKYFLKMKRKEPFALENLFDGFKLYVPSFLLALLIYIFTLLWALLFVVPGIIAAISYSQAYFILVDNPDLSAMEAIKKSKEMMCGHKWFYFKMLFSFIGWGLLCLFTVGIGFLWLIPYAQMTVTNFYDELKS